MISEERVEMIKKYFTFWDKLTDGQKKMLYENMTDVRYDKGANIHGNDGECTGAILVKNGQIRAYILSEEGREITL